MLPVAQQAFPPSDPLLKAIALHQTGNLKEAETIYHALLTSNPKHVHALTLLGTIYAQRGHCEEGIRLMKQAIAIKPDHTEAHYNLGLTLQMLGHHEAALASYTKTIATDPNHAEAFNNMGLALYNLGQYRHALESQEKAIAIDVNYAEAYFNKGLLKLLLGEYEEGWKLYEWRWKRDGHAKARAFHAPLWLGEESLAGTTILLHTEQGLGDAIQFCRYIPMVQASGAKVILEAPASLIELFSTLKASFQSVTFGNPLPPFDLHCPLLSLPLAFKTTVNSIPADIPYLYVNTDKQKRWQKVLGKKMRPRIGLAWSGSAANINDRNRSIALNLLNPLLRCDWDFHSLQKEVRPADEAVLKEYSQIASHAERLHDFADTAALIAEMDIVISVDTSIAHLAGALGKRVWILLPCAPDFRWMTEREDSPWYPTARLFRQSSAGDWAGVITRMKTELQKTLS